MQTPSEEILVNIVDELKSDGEVVDKSDVELAYKILQNLPNNSATALIPKGGPKFNDYLWSEAEQLQLQSYHNARKDMFMALKVRKLDALGLARWLPELHVAEIIKQGKFMQVQGFAHENDFLALYPEEALFLLDVGDIELEYGGSLLAMQDAYNLLFSSDHETNSCTFDDYCVYAHLWRMGYRVQRYFETSFDDEEDLDSSPSCKRERSSDGTSSSDPKKLKVVESSAKVVKESSFLISIANPSVKNVQSETDVLSNNMEYRDWWLDDGECLSDDAIAHSSRVEISATAVQMPNLAHRTDAAFILQELPNHLLPKQTCSWEFEVEQIWFDRLKKDDCPKTTLVYSHPRKIDYADICAKARDWPHYKELVKNALQEKRQEVESLHQRMYSGEIKPLVKPNDVKTFNCVFDQIKIFKNTNSTDFIEPLHKCFKLRFNVFQSDPEKAFKKSNPGKPLVRVCVTSPTDPIPTLADAQALHECSDGVPVKFALVNDGKVLFYGFDSINIPIDNAFT